MFTAVTDCKTAADVRRIATAVLRRRREQREREIKARELRAITAAEVLQQEEELRGFLQKISEHPAELAPPLLAEPVPTIYRIQLTVCRRYGITVADLESPSRHNSVMVPRRISYLLCRMLTLNGLPTIGRAHGNRNHSTVLHSVRKLGWLRIKLDQELTGADPLELWIDRAHQHMQLRR